MKFSDLDKIQKNQKYIYSRNEYVENKYVENIWITAVRQQNLSVELISCHSNQTANLKAIAIDKIRSVKFERISEAIFLKYIFNF